MEQEIQKRIQICSQIGGHRGQNSVGLLEQEIQKGIQMCSQIEGTERTEWCWFHGTRDTEKDTDMQPDRRTERTEWCWFNRTGNTE